MRKTYLFIIIFFIPVLLFTQGCADADTNSKMEGTLSLHVLDPKDIPGKWLLVSNRNSTNPYLNYLYIIQNGEMKAILQDRHLLNGKWSPDGDKFLASAAGDPISFIYVFTEDGKELTTIETNRLARDFCWIDDTHIIYSDGWTSDTEEGLVILYNLESKEKKILYKTPFKYEASDLHISHDMAKLIFYISPILSARGKERIPQSILIDLKSFKIKEIGLIGGIAGWLHDNKNVIVTTNWKLDRSDFNDKYGVIAKYNIETNELTAMKENQGFYIRSSLSPDGRYLYYAKSTADGGVAIFVQSLESNDEWQLTKPVYVSERVGMSQDLPTSWIPDDKIDFLKDLSKK